MIGPTPAARTIILSIGGLLTFYQPGVGAKLPAGGEPADIVDLIEHGKGQHIADPTDGLQQMQRRRIVTLGQVQNFPIQLRYNRIVVIDQPQISLDHKPDNRIREMAHDILVPSVMRPGKRARRRQVILVGGSLDMT